MGGLRNGQYTLKSVVGNLPAGVELGSVVRVITDGSNNVVSPLFFVQRQLCS